MADTHSKSVRSYNMSRIRSRDTKPEIIVRKFLFSKGFRYKLHDKNLPGKPDIVLPKYKTVIFIHGCFWHGHKGCNRFVLPKTKVEYWHPKIQKNIVKDEVNLMLLEVMRWRAITVWECELSKKNVQEMLEKLQMEIFEKRIY